MLEQRLDGMLLETGMGIVVIEGMLLGTGMGIVVIEGMLLGTGWALGFHCAPGLGIRGKGRLASPSAQR